MAKKPSNIDYAKVVKPADVKRAKDAKGISDDQAEARQYLQDTDWYAIRQIELGTVVPKDVADKRAAARAAI